VRVELPLNAVLFQIQAFSQTGVIGNLFYAVGFKLFGRPLQTRFARAAGTCETLERLETYGQLVHFLLRRTIGNVLCINTT
jgi:hypothetical protein